ncbi:DUF2341 domain-containing protein, partial [Candidatus Parcubacteria bacterium]|nr:DUF2341 domain-containing protein [Candidatus Parcubacteria bacterium]
MNKKHFILFIILTLLASGVLLFGKDRFNNTTDDIIIPKEFIFQGKTIALAWTDDNTGEDLIIQSDRKEYSGFNEVDVYFSITNTNKEDQEMDVVVWVGNEKVEVKSIERLNEDNEAAGSIDAGTGLQPVSKYFPSERIDDISKHQERVANPFPQEEAEQSQAGSTASFRSRSTSDNGANDTRKDIKGFTSGYAVNDQIKSGETNFYRTKIKYPPMSDGEFFIEAFGVLRRLDGDLREKESAKTNKPLSRQSGKRDDEIAYGHLDPWYSSSWSYRRQIIIDHSEVADVADPSATYAGFSVYVHATGLSNIKADGADVRFTDSAGTELPREIEKYASGTLDAWVKFTLTKDAGDTSDDVIYMYYGNTDATEPAEDATYGREKVWDDNFVMVQHLSEIPDNTVGQIKDSTSNANDGQT